MIVVEHRVMFDDAVEANSCLGLRLLSGYGTLSSVSITKQLNECT